MHGKEVLDIITENLTNERLDDIAFQMKNICVLKKKRAGNKICWKKCPHH